MRQRWFCAAKCYFRADGRLGTLDVSYLEPRAGAAIPHWQMDVSPFGDGIFAIARQDKGRPAASKLLHREVLACRIAITKVTAHGSNQLLLEVSKD